jgi:xylan 1,4-beta-xylosidase
MSQWRFEVWMKYHEDLTPMETPSEYAQKYMVFYKTVKKSLPKCTIGGPCFNMSGRFQDFKLLILNLEKYSLPFDYISVSAYCYELKSNEEPQDFSTIGIISLDNDHIIDNFNLYSNYLKKSHLYQTIPLYITEFGSTLSAKNHITESVFQAAFLCKNMIGLLPYCSCIAYSYFIDTMRSATSPQKIQSFSGLIAENGIPKPSLHAYALLNKLGKNLISMGSNYILTSNSVNRYQLLCYHYTHFSKSYCFNSWDNVRMENTYDIFAEEAPDSIHFSCNGLPSGKYKITQLSLNRNYGSVLDKYLRILDRGNISSTEFLCSIINLCEDETNYYKQTTLPRQDIFYLTCSDILELNFTLEQHEVVFYEFSRVL